MKIWFFEVSITSVVFCKVLLRQPSLIGGRQTEKSGRVQFLTFIMGVLQEFSAQHRLIDQEQLK